MLLLLLLLVYCCVILVSNSSALYTCISLLDIFNITPFHLSLPSKRSFTQNGFLIHGLYSLWWQDNTKKSMPVFLRTKVAAALWGPSLAWAPVNYSFSERSEQPCVWLEMELMHQTPLTDSQWKTVHIISPWILCDVVLSHSHDKKCSKSALHRLYCEFVSRYHLIIRKNVIVKQNLLLYLSFCTEVNLSYNLNS